MWDKDEIEDLYCDNIILPERATTGSAGYDIYAPCEITVKYNESKIIPTGLRCIIDGGWFLNLVPRSGNGFKYGIHLANTCGIIDSDYAYADNNGHILIKIVNDSCVNTDKSDFVINAFSAFCQGIFLEYGITLDDKAESKRTGGFGSTGE